MSESELDNLNRLLSASLRGDASAKDALFRGMHRVALAECRRRLRRPSAFIEAEDLANDSMLDLAVNFGGVRADAGGKSLVALVRRIARMKILNAFRHYRQRKRDPRRECRGDAIERLLDDSTDADRRAELLRDWVRERLGPRHSRVIGLREQGFTIGQIAEESGYHERTVRRMIEDVRRELLADD